MEFSVANDLTWVQHFVESTDSHTARPNTDPAPTQLMSAFKLRYESPNTFFVHLSGSIAHYGHNEAESSLVALRLCEEAVANEVREQLSGVIQSKSFTCFDGQTIEFAESPWEFASVVAAYFCPTMTCSAHFQDERHLPAAVA
jgi:hypothetical protein